MNFKLIKQLKSNVLENQTLSSIRLWYQNISINDEFPVWLPIKFFPKFKIWHFSLFLSNCNCFKVTTKHSPKPKFDVLSSSISFFC